MSPLKLRRIDFYPADWFAGTMGLSCCERGLYITACAMIYANGGPVAIDDLRAYCQREHGNKFNRLLQKLLHLRKLIPTDEGKLTNIRCEEEMRKAHERITKASENGVRGNEIKKLAAATRSLSPSPSPSPEKILPFLVVDNESQTGEEDPKLRDMAKPAKSKRPKQAAPDGAVDQEFEDFWKLWPNKQKRVEARKSYAKARSKVAAETILAGVKSRILYCDKMKGAGWEPPFWPHPTTWLNQELWTDELPAVKPRKSWQELQEERAEAEMYRGML